VIFHLLSLIPIVLVKSSAVTFSLQRERKIPGVVFRKGYDWDGEPRDQLLVN
jgi:hypothetical protein